MDEPSVQLQLDLRHAVQNELATCRPLLHRLQNSTYLLQIPRPAHAVRHGSRFYYNILVYCCFHQPKEKSQNWFSSHQPQQTEAGTVLKAEELLREIELLASSTRSKDGGKSYDAVEDELSRLETLVDVAVVQSHSLFNEAFLREIQINVPVFAPQEAIDRMLELQHFRTVVALATYGEDGYNDWRDTTLPPLPEWVGLGLLPKSEDERRSAPTLLVAFNNHYHNGNWASNTSGSSNKPRGARQKRHTPNIPNEESAEAIFFTEHGLMDIDSQLLCSADPPMYPLAVLEGPQSLSERLSGSQDDSEEGETSRTHMYKAKYNLFERNNVPDRGHGFLAWLIAKANSSFRGGSQQGLGELQARENNSRNKEQRSDRVELVNGQSTVLI